MKLRFARILVGIGVAIEWLFKLAFGAALGWMLWMMFGPEKFAAELFQKEALLSMGLGILGALVVVGLFASIITLFAWAQRTKKAADAELNKE